MSDEKQRPQTGGEQKSTHTSDSVDFHESVPIIKAASGFNLQNALNKPVNKDTSEKK
ncbi:MAG: hypothetical protein P4L72_15870 [Parvibaculum sp.]|uniref:hypothetical protein n=1 Tax=Parvibaculum sp. TaxID=2024848 RepID=UPI00284EEBC0|nr:hypothetical protein [Parvibaculum sp.]MDR3500692.1 hypothetical protein [Parvibaculum sp.]